jgi:hypothetical protein
MEENMLSKNLEVSTAHISQQDAKLLDEASDCPGAPPVVVYKYPEGYFLYVPEATEDFKDIILIAHRAGFSKNVLDLMANARQNKCKYVHIDRDSEVYPDIPTYEW